MTPNGLRLTVAVVLIALVGGGLTKLLGGPQDSADAAAVAAATAPPAIAGVPAPTDAPAGLGGHVAQLEPIVAERLPASATLALTQFADTYSSWPAEEGVDTFRRLAGLAGYQAQAAMLEEAGRGRADPSQEGRSGRLESIVRSGQAYLVAIVQDTDAGQRRRLFAAAVMQTPRGWQVTRWEPRR